MSDAKSKELSAEKVVSFDATVGMEEVAAIKVAEIEGNLLVRGEQIRKDIRDAEAEVAKAEAKFQDYVVEDTKASYPELDKAEKALRAIFGKEVSVTISQPSPDGKIHVELHGKGNVAWKGDTSKDLKKQIDALQKKISTLENEAVEVKKGMTMLPHVERRAKAAVAKARLSQSKEGMAILGQLDSLTLPGLPAPK